MISESYKSIFFFVPDLHFIIFSKLIMQWKKVYIKLSSLLIFPTRPLKLKKKL